MTKPSSITTIVHNQNQKDQPEWLQRYISINKIQAGPLITTIYDLSLSVGWKDLRILSIPPIQTEKENGGEGWVILIGHKREQDPLRAVLPIPLHTTSFRPSLLSHVFKYLSSITISSLPEPFPLLAPTIDQLQRKDITSASPAPEEQEESEEQESKEQTIDYETLYTAIVNDDSTVVYYKLSKGIKKPADIPDE